MVKKVNNNVFYKSQYAIRDYMHFRSGNAVMHKARVLVSYRGKNKYNNVLTVHPKIETNYSYVEIFGDDEFHEDYYIKYTNEYQEFNLVNGTLLIKGEDRWGNPIEINIIRA